MKLWQRVTSVPVGLGLAASLWAAVPAAPAHAAPAPALAPVAAKASTCKIKGFTPKTIVIDESPITVTIRPILTSGCRASVWTVKTGAFTATEDNPTVTLTPNKALLRYAGRNDVTIRARSASGKLVKKTYNNKLRLQRNVGYVADPNAVTSAPKNSSVQLQSQLVIANWANPQSDQNPTLGREYFRVQFKTKGGSYRTVKKARYQGNGDFGVSYVNVKVTRTGYWRWVFDGTSSIQAENSPGQYITVTS